MSDKVRVGISVGDLNGIGIEIILKTFRDARIYDMCTPILYCAPKAVNYNKKVLEIDDIKLNIVKDVTKLRPSCVNVFPAWEDDVRVNFGNPDSTLGKYAFLSLKSAVEDLASRNLDVLVTAPINKHTIQSEEFNFPGHTEFLANYANEDNYLMTMVSDVLKVATITSHIPLKDVEKSLTEELIINKLNTFVASLKTDFGIRLPKIAFLGLNPHSGDNGTLGDYEEKILKPIIKRLADKDGFKVFGPFGADGFFGSREYLKFDGVISMYHDQGLIPFKTISFEEGVNFTAGLSIVRTSPDHGVGYDIAGKGLANEQSFRSAVYTACDIFNTRKREKEFASNPLKIKPQKAFSKKRS